MANISDVIENFILQTLGDDNELNMSRNDMAIHFSCAPSQINYVLTTRFSPSRGYLIESKRGGGGFVRLIKLNLDNNEYVVNNIINLIGERISHTNAIYILEMLEQANVLKQEQTLIAKILLSDKAISNPFKLEDSLRATMLKTLIYNNLKGEMWYDVRKMRTKGSNCVCYSK